MQSIEVDQPFHRVGWTYEEKYDGWRMIAYKDGKHVQLISRARKDHSHRFADLAAAIRTLPPVRLILDGEVAISDDKLISRFEWFRRRPEEVSTPPIYMTFDWQWVIAWTLCATTAFFTISWAARRISTSMVFRPSARSSSRILV